MNGGAGFTPGPVKTPILVDSGTWRGNVIRRARKGSRCDYFHGAAIGKCKNRIEPGDLYLEGEMNDTAGGYGSDRYCMNCVAGHEGVTAAIAKARGAA